MHREYQQSEQNVSSVLKKTLTIPLFYIEYIADRQIIMFLILFPKLTYARAGLVFIIKNYYVFVYSSNPPRFLI